MEWLEQNLSSIFLVMFLVGFLFTALSAVFSGAFGHGFGEGSSFDAGAEPGTMGGDIGHIDGAGTAEVGWAQHSLSTFSPLSPTTISAFITAAGGIGYMALEWWEWSPLGAGVLAIFSGIIFAGVIIVLLTVLFRVTQGTSVGSVASLVGKEADVTVTIPAGGTGEIAYVLLGQRLSCSARTGIDSAVPQGSRVVIKDVSSSTYLVEETRESWLARNRTQATGA